MLSRILVATDFCRGGQRAVERAAQLPLAPGALITILHVVPSTGVADLDRRAGEQAQLSLEEAAAAAARTAKATGSQDTSLRTMWAHGNALEEVLRHTEGEKAHLVVIGRHGRRGFKKLLLGSTSERILRHGRVPVLVVGAGQPRPYRRVLVATDFSDASRRAFEVATRIGDPRRCDLELLHVNWIPFDARRDLWGEDDERSRIRDRFRSEEQSALIRFLAALDMPATGCKITLRRGDPRVVVLNEAARRQVRLIAVGTSGRSGISRVLIGSVAEAVARHATCDVLVVRQ